jgi:anti-sigma B factor antagonist
MAASPTAPPDFRVHVEQAPGAAIVAVSGELDLVTAPQLAAVLDTARHDGAVVVDLCEVPFCDSSGLTTLFHARDALERDGRRFAVACVPESAVRRVLTVSGADQMLGVQPSREAALRAVS